MLIFQNCSFSRAVGHSWCLIQLTSAPNGPLSSSSSRLQRKFSSSPRQPRRGGGDVLQRPLNVERQKKKNQERSPFRGPHAPLMLDFAFVKPWGGSVSWNAAPNAAASVAVHHSWAPWQRERGRGVGGGGSVSYHARARREDEGANQNSSAYQSIESLCDVPE